MICQSCSKERNKLRIVPSKLMQTKWNLCDVCIVNGYEPRWAIILVGRSKGMDIIVDYIRQHKYVGAEIAVKDIVS